MSQLTMLEAEERSNGQDSVKKTLNSEIGKNEAIEGTPFRIVMQADKWAIVMGKHVLTEPKDTEEEALELLKTEKWNLAMRLCVLINGEMKKRKRNR